MADKRAFAKFDVGYLDNPKMMDVLDESSNAIIMHFASILYCSQHLTDGVVASKAMQRKSGGTESDVQILISAGLWHTPNHDCDSCPQPPAGKVYVHDFLEHNREAADAKRVSKVRSDVAKASWEKRKGAMQIALQNEDVCNAEREREKDKEESEIANAIPRDDVDALLDLLDACIEANGSRKPSRTKKNHDAARLLLDRDGYTTVQVEWMIRWATSHEFWRGNILSMSKLREKFDQLKAQVDRGNQAATVGFSGEINPDAILGKDHWVPGAPPEGLSISDEIQWKKDQRAAHNAERLAETRERMGAA